MDCTTVKKVVLKLQAVEVIDLTRYYLEYMSGLWI